MPQLQENPPAPGNASSATVTLQNGRSEEAIVRTNTPPPPFRGSLPTAQPVAAPTIASHAPLAATAHHLLENTDAAIARHIYSSESETDGKPASVRIGALQVWQKQDGSWKLLVRQGFKLA